jgi:hypothetical protein
VAAGSNNLIANGSTVILAGSSNNVMANGSTIMLTGGTSNAFMANTTIIDIGVGTTNNIICNSTVMQLSAGGGATLMSINATVVNCTTNTALNLGSSSKAANGYTWLPNGVLMQWGITAANSTAGNATFATAFPTACIHCTVTGLYATTNNIWQVAPPNTTVATIRNSIAGAVVNVHYLAIGY